MKAFDPEVIIAIGGGGFIPARMLRTELKARAQPPAPPPLPRTPSLPFPAVPRSLAPRRRSGGAGK